MTVSDRKTGRRSGIQEQLGTLDAISQLLTASIFNLDALLDEIARITAQKLRVKACAIRLLDKQTGEMVLKAVYGLSQRYLSHGPVIASRSVYRQVIESGQPVQVLDISRDPHMQYPEEALAEGIRSRLTVGLLRDGRPIGALSVFTDRPYRFTDGDIQVFQTIANQTAVAVHLAQLHLGYLRTREMTQELAIAARIQKNLLPEQVPRSEAFCMAVSIRPCKEIGGDFYDFIDLPGKNLGIAIGDVSGKGTPAALLVGSVCTALRVQAERIYAMREIVGGVNRLLCRYTRQEQFATLFYGVLNIPQRVLTYVNAGHNYPLVFRDGQAVSLESGGPPLGFFPEQTYSQQVIQLLTGDILVLYTDGFTEAIDRNEEFFGEERLRKIVAQHQDLDPEQIAGALEDAVAGFEDVSGGHIDDRTLVVLKLY